MKRDKEKQSGRENETKRKRRRGSKRAGKMLATSTIHINNGMHFSCKYLKKKTTEKHQWEV